METFIANILMMLKMLCMADFVQEIKRQSKTKR